MQAHPLCLILPEMTDLEYRQLVDDIRKNGLLRPIVTYDGMILDGRHRYRACADAGVNPRFEDYAGDEPAGFVQSCSTHRNLNPTQRALVAAGFLEYERGKARERQAHGVTAPGRTLVENVPQASSGKARDQAGERMGVSGKSVSTAAAVIEKAVPEIIEKCRSGEMALNEAKRVVGLNPTAQRRIASLPKKARTREIESALVKSMAAKDRHKKPAAIDPPGSPFVRTVLSGIERLALFAAEKGIKTGDDLAERFLSEMDWDDPALTSQLDRSEALLHALALIQRARNSRVSNAA